MNGRDRARRLPVVNAPSPNLRGLLPGGVERFERYVQINPYMVYPYGVHAVVGTRRSRKPVMSHIERYVIAYDVGKAVDPKLVEGQIAGGLAQGVGGALLEEFRYDERRAPFGHVRRLPDADRTRVPDVSILVTEDAPKPTQSPWIEGRGRR